MRTREERLEDLKLKAGKQLLLQLARGVKKQKAVPKGLPGRQKSGTPKKLSPCAKAVGVKSARPSAAKQSRAAANKENTGTGVLVPRYRQSTAATKAKEETQPPPIGKLADWSATMESEHDELTSRLDDIRRESLRPSIRGDYTGPLPQSATRAILQPVANTPSLAARLQALKRDPKHLKDGAAALGQGEQGEFVPAGQIETRSLAVSAKELFDDPGFAELCEKGMSAQLQRTKDGATERSRIAELAGLVKILRRALKELTTRSTAFVSAGLQFEKEAHAQIEAIKLSSKSSSKQMEAELANLKRDAAQAAAAHKQAMASWHIEVDCQKAEASHAKRELERMEAERDRAREETRRAEEIRAAVEGNVKGIKKEAGQQLRELQVDHGQAKRMLQEAQEAHARHEKDLKDRIEDLEKRCEDALAGLSAAEAEASSLKQELWQRGEDLAMVTRAKEELQKDCHKLATGLAEHEQLQREVAAWSNSSAAEATILEQRCAALTQQLQSQKEMLGSAQEQMKAMEEGHAMDMATIQNQLKILRADLQDSVEREADLQGEKSQLKAALNASLETGSKLDTDLKQAKGALDTLKHQLHDTLGREQHAKEAATSAAECLQQVTAQLEETQQSLETEVAARQALAADAAVKASRLARIEGEFEAMQEAIGTGSVDQAEMLGRLISRVASLEAAVAESHCARRELHNQLVNLRGNIRVFCRVKPHPKPALACLPDGLSVKAEVDGKEQSFSFDKVFGAAVSQQAVFGEVSELVQSALDGYQVCLFSYGQTGAGKTHTMQGGRTADTQGIIPRAIIKILEEADRLRGEGWEYELEASFVEVYNESLRDLLAEGKGRDVGKLPDANVIKHHPAGGPSSVVGATRTRISTPQGAAALVKRAAAARAVEATAMNAASSRSHSIFMLYICGHHAGSATTLMGALNLVDLAGSERLNRSQAEGQRQKEACSINKSLSALGDVFTALAARNPHVPYRNSKLTHLLQPCLGGDGKTLMFVNVNPEAESLQETICSLRFATKVNACQTGAKGGAKRHVSMTGDARSSLQGVKRQSVTATAKRKATAAPAQKVGRAKLG